MRQFLQNKIYAIHTVKCWKTGDFSQAHASFVRLGELKELVAGAEDEATLNEIHEQINQWAGTEPIALDREIQQIMG